MGVEVLFTQELFIVLMQAGEVPSGATGGQELAGSGRGWVRG
jgi:hypothetical protein